ncbi:Crp/Fnr family transcriptional regulator [Novispirillum itersonii]|uniref:Crp/Fnr family transcriptional regulator n=1 Tax=Novispirillum itersonii TaxID=189 RepID=UPI00036C75A7|nr:cyclic nucleotide-binding domain-containing protein [Novispirillum itersonii]
MNADPYVKLIADPGHNCGCCDLEDRAFCAGLGSQGSALLRSIRGSARLEAHHTVFREGDAASHIFTVVKGAVKLSKLMADGRRQIVGFLFPGDFFGFGLAGSYTYSAETIVPTSLCRFSERRLASLMEENGDLRRRLFGRLVDELGFAQEQMLLLGRMTAREKVAHFLTMLSRRAANRGDSATVVAVPMSRLDMADYLGLTIETVSRTITTLKKDALIEVPSPNVVSILKADALRQIADGNGDE